MIILGIVIAAVIIGITMYSLSLKVLLRSSRLNAGFIGRWIVMCIGFVMFMLALAQIVIMIAG